MTESFSLMIMIASIIRGLHPQGSLMMTAAAGHDEL